MLVLFAIACVTESVQTGTPTPPTPTPTPPPEWDGRIESGTWFPEGGQVSTDTCGLDNGQPVVAEEIEVDSTDGTWTVWIPDALSCQETADHVLHCPLPPMDTAPGPDTTLENEGELALHPVDEKALVAFATSMVRCAGPACADIGLPDDVDCVLELEIDYARP